MALIIEILLAAAAGFTHGQEKINLAPAVIFPIVWLYSGTRLRAFVIALTYYIVASRGLYLSAPVFFGEGTVITSIALWWGSALSLSLPWVLLYNPIGENNALTDNRLKVTFRIFKKILLITILLTIPPLGYWGWANPLVAAGYIFPKTRYLGFLLLMAVWSYTGSFIITKKDNGILAAVLAGGVLLIQGLAIVPMIYGEAQMAKEWTGVQTNFERLTSGSDNSIGEYERYKWLKEKLVSTEGKYVVLPETVAGAWSQTTEQIWQPLTNLFTEQNRTYLVGAEEQKKDSYKYYNVVKIRGASNDEIKQRMPVPYSMWRPWDKYFGTIAAWTEKRFITIDHQKVVILICYEPYLMFPPLVSFSSFPDVLVCVSNSWWSKNSSLPAFSDQNVKSWSLLFDTPYVISKNL